MEAEPFADDRALKSPSFRRLMAAFIAILGCVPKPSRRSNQRAAAVWRGGNRASRAATYWYPREKGVWLLTLFIHVAECAFFYTEAKYLDDDVVQPHARVLLAVIPITPVLLLANKPE